MATGTQIQALIVEDSPTIRQDLVASLKKLGLSCQIAENGLAGWMILLETKKSGKKFDVIFSDLNMPEMDGLQLLEHVRSDAMLAKTPFIILTANKEELLRMTALCLDVNAFFIKPADPTQIRQNLQRLFPGKKFQE